MRVQLIEALALATCLSSLAHAQCPKDNRAEKRDGILVTDFRITGTTTLSSDELAKIAGDFIGVCYTDDSEEIAERLRLAFQERGYFTVEVKDFTFKPGDPLGSPKPVAVEANVVEGIRYKAGEIKFVGNHSFNAQQLRDEFPLRKGDLFSRSKVATGLESLRKLYSKKGFVDLAAVPDTQFTSSGSVNLTVTITEGTQYRMGKIEILTEKEKAERLRIAWQLSEGSIYDNTYIEKFVEENRNLLPDGFTADDVKRVFDCPKAVADVSFPIDSPRASGEAPWKSIPCENGKRNTAEKR